MASFSASARQNTSSGYRPGYRVLVAGTVGGYAIEFAAIERCGDPCREFGLLPSHFTFASAVTSTFLHDDAEHEQGDRIAGDVKHVPGSWNACSARFALVSCTSAALSAQHVAVTTRQRDALLHRAPVLATFGMRADPPAATLITPLAGGRDVGR